MIVLGVDPGLASMGLAVVSGGNLLHVEVVRTKKQAGLRSVDDVRRVRELLAGLDAVVGRYMPAVMVAEVPTGAQSSRAAMAIGMMVATLAATSAHHGLRLHLVTPRELKERTTGSTTASKAEMITAVEARIPGALDNVLRTQREHAADAVAAALASTTAV